MTNNRTSRCPSCKAEIVWTITSKGKHMPVDAKAQAGFVLSDDDPPRAIGGAIHVSHFATCPNADHHRKERS